MQFGFGDARPGLRALMLTAAGGLGLLLLTAPPAQAGDEFERGFKDEIGRIAAHEAFGLGRHIVADVILGYGGHGYSYQRPIHHQTYYRHSYYRNRHDRGHHRRHKRYRHHHQRRHHDRHHHGHGCGH